MRKFRLTFFAFSLFILHSSLSYCQLPIVGSEDILDKMRLNKGINGIETIPYANIKGDPYYFKDFQRKPYAVYSLGDMKMDPDPLITPTLLKDETISKKIWVSSILENADFLFTKYDLGVKGPYICSIYNKTTKVVTFLKDNVFKNDLGGGIGFWPKQIVDDKILVDYADAFDLLKGIIPTNLRRKLTVTSNPVLIILK